MGRELSAFQQGWNPEDEERVRKQREEQERKDKEAQKQDEETVENLS
jgi:hypothetical protein